MAEHFITRFEHAEPTLRLPELHQALYDADTLFLPRTVVCLHARNTRKRNASSPASSTVPSSVITRIHCFPSR